MLSRLPTMGDKWYPENPPAFHRPVACYMPFLIPVPANLHAIQQRNAMNRAIKLILTLLLFSSSLVITSACSKAGGGAVAGAGVGGAVGALTSKNKVLGGAIGAGAGMVLGYAIGNELDKADARKVQEVAEHGKSNVPVQWTNPNTGRSYQATAAPAQLNADGLIQRDIDLVSPGGTIIKATWIRDDQGEWYLAER